MPTLRTRLILLAAATLLAAGASPAEVTVLRQGVSPTGDYAGCIDTALSGRRHYGRSGALRCDARSRVLIRFDLDGIDTAHVIHRAVLRVADTDYPRCGRDGKLPAGQVACFRVARSWTETANWLQYERTDKRRGVAGGNWKTPGGDLDRETDFGAGDAGRVATDTLRFDPSIGHVHDLDVTALVRRWHAGKLPNHGLALIGVDKARCTLAAGEWRVPAARPALLIEHGPKGGEPEGIPAPPAPPSAEKLHDLAATADPGAPSGDYDVVRVGQNANCALRGASTDAYVKEARDAWPGNWGWMNMSRVGGAAADVSRALLYFDLEGIPATASVKQARLVLSLAPYRNDEVRGRPYGAFLLAPAGTPPFAADEVDAAQRKADAPWPAGGVLAASPGAPVAVGEVADEEYEDWRGRKGKRPGTLTFDLTGVVRAWLSGKAPNGGLVLDNRLAGGAYDYYSSRSYRPQKRPYLEITLSPAPGRKPEPIKVTPGLPEGDYWVGPMREVHKRFDGKPGTLTQYGDSITVTMAFMAPYGWGQKIEPKNCPPEVKKEMEVIEKHSDLKLWKDWKGSQWGCTGMKTSPWWYAGVDAWQKRMDPEAAVILFGTNDLGGICPPRYTEYMAASVRRLLEDGTVPMLTTVPPHGGRALSMTDDYWLALICIASHYKVPVIDYYKETLRRRPKDWNGKLDKFRPAKGYGVPTIISGDGCHPSNPKEYQNDFSEKALSSNGYNLRNYMTLRMYYQVISKVFQAK